MAVDASLKGRTFPPTDPYPVSRERIAEFARATGSQYDGGPAPATFPIVVAFGAMTALMEDPSVGIELHRVVHGEQRFSYQRPVQAGDVLQVVITVESIRSASGNDIVSNRADVRTTDGELVVTAFSTLVARGTA